MTEPSPSATGSRLRIPRLAIQAAIAVGFFLLLYVAFTFFQVWSATDDDNARPSDAIIVLGAAQYSGTPSPALAGRLDHALALHQDGIAPLIVVTGGGQEGDISTEAKSGYDYLRERGVPEASILLEVDGTSTWESLAASYRFLEPQGALDVVLVSDPSHSYRLRGVADEIGFTAVVSPTGANSSLQSLLRETVAVGVGRLVGYERLNRLLG